MQLLFGRNTTQTSTTNTRLETVTSKLIYLVASIETRDYVSYSVCGRNKKVNSCTSLIKLN